MKVALCSIPKSGTYLLTNYFIELGLTNSHLHLNDNEYSNYSKASIIEARTKPEKFKIEESFPEAIKNICDNNFVVGHFSIENKKYLKSFKKLFVYRDLKYCCVSFGFWTATTSRWINYEKDSKWRKDINNKDFIANFLKIHGKSVYYLFHKTFPWFYEEDVLNLKFENLIGENGKEIQIDEFKKIANYLDIDLSIKELESKISNTLNKSSLTKLESKTDYNSYITNNFYKEFNLLGFNKLNRKLGYDKYFNKLSNNLFKVKKSFYDIYWVQNKRSLKSWSYGINIINDLIKNYRFNSILDAGCGSADVVRYLITKGYNAKGIEVSSQVLKKYAPDLLRKKIVQQGDLIHLPYKDNSFDVIFSSEVLEHIPVNDIPSVISEFYRVTNHLVFLTISLRPSSNFNRYHINLKERKWWEEEFKKVGFIKEDLTVLKLQKTKQGASVKEILELGPTKSHIHEMEWFIENEPIDFEGELEPWYFVFRKNE